MEATGENWWNRKVFNTNWSKIKYVNHHNFCYFKDKAEHKLPVSQFCMPVSYYFAQLIYDLFLDYEPLRKAMNWRETNGLAWKEKYILL